MIVLKWNNDTYVINVSIIYEFVFNMYFTNRNSFFQ